MKKRVYVVIGLMAAFGATQIHAQNLEMTDPPAFVPPCSHGEHPRPLDVTGVGGPSSKPRVGGGLTGGPGAGGPSRARSAASVSA